uniref:Short-chain dehydrogenase/reductase family protein n=1 Tax=Mycena chlorophos TaxID=658473 RepID=A0ABQ0MAH8_MYCCL|nr:short-chain dehydrogenase/reductase family protein [Mycena chlorophos]
MAPKFQPERDIPDLSGRVMLVTGGNSGIGYETVKQLLLKGARVYLAARSKDKATTAIAKLEAETGGKRAVLLPLDLADLDSLLLKGARVYLAARSEDKATAAIAKLDVETGGTGKRAVFLPLDLADLDSVRKAAERFLELEEKLDLLLNNAGVMNVPTEMLTAQGYDLQFGTNAIGHFLLTELLLPALLKSKETTGIPARIVHVSSIGHNLAPTSGIDYTSLKGGPERDTWLKNADGWVLKSSWRLYGQSKLTNILMSNYFARLHAGRIVSCAVHPGPVKTELGRFSPGWMRVLNRLFFYPASVGASTQLWAGTTAGAEEINGKYFVPFCKPSEPSKLARHVGKQEEVVAYLKSQLHVVEVSRLDPNHLSLSGDAPRSQPRRPRPP